MMTIDHATVRLTFGDDLFLRRHRSVGTPIVNQFVWRLDDVAPTSALVRLRDELARGALSRRADRPRVPGARGRWSRAPHAPPIDVEPTVLQDCDVVDWLRANHTAPLHPGRGESWRLASARLSDGGSLLSLIVDHAVADGGAMVDAVERATSGRAPLTLPDRDGTWGALRADLEDATRQVRAVVRWGATSALRRRGGATSSAGATPAPTPDGPTAPEGWVVPTVVAECRTADVEAAAARHGGTLNTWFVALGASLVVTAGITDEDGPVVVALPVTARGADDPRANATRIARVAVDPRDLRHHDLAPLRAGCRQAYAELGTRDTSAGDDDSGSLLTLVQMLPDALVRRLPVPTGPRVLASNLGTMSPAFSAPTGTPARSIAALAGHRVVDDAEIRALGGGLTAWACTSGGRTTVTVAALDPARVPDDETLRDLVRSGLAAWHVEARLW